MSDKQPTRTEQDDTIPRAQVETALNFLEWSHGDALQRPWSDEAQAYYQAIDILEAALDEDLLPPDEVRQSESYSEAIERSREAREEGYAAATLFDERSGKERPREAGAVDYVRGFIRSFLP